MVCRVIHDGPCDSHLNADCWGLNILCALSGIILCSNSCGIRVWGVPVY